jgi:hypothetical protein
MLKNNVPAPSCIPLAGLKVLTRRFVLVLVLVLVLDLWGRGASMFIRPSADANAPAGFCFPP